MYLPTQTPAASKWSVWDYQDRSKTTPAAAADGLCRVEFDQVPDNELWLIDRIVISNDSTFETVFSLYKQAVADGNRLDGTDIGNLNVADESAPIVVQPNTLLIALWTGASTGARGMISIQYTIMRPTPLPTPTTLGG